MGIEVSELHLIASSSTSSFCTVKPRI